MDIKGVGRVYKLTQRPDFNVHYGLIYDEKVVFVGSSDKEVIEIHCKKN